MKRRIALVALASSLVLLTTATAQAQFSVQYGRGWRGGTSYGVSMPYFSGSYSRGYPYAGYGYPYYGSRYYDYGYYRPSRGFSISVGSSPYYYSPYTTRSYYGPGYYTSPGYYYSSPGYVTSPGYVMDSRPVTYQAFYSGPRANDDQALIRVRLPVDARLQFQGQLTQQTGSERFFVSPSLERGKTFTYTLTASWMENGGAVTQEKKVDVAAGREVIVDFNEGRISAQTSAEPLIINNNDLRRLTHAGKVVKVENGQLVMVTTTGNEEHRHTLAANAEVIIDGKRATLADLKAGMRIEVTTKEGDKTIATKIEAKSPDATGLEENNRDAPP